MTLKEQWLKALRSGEYKQGKYCLKGPRGFCCLGVLADVIDSGKWKAVGETFSHSYKKWGTDRGFIPYHILEEDTQEVLSEMNDSGADFNEIADYIEESNISPNYPSPRVTEDNSRVTEDNSQVTEDNSQVTGNNSQVTEDNEHD